MTSKCNTEKLLNYKGEKEKRKKMGKKSAQR